MMSNPHREQRGIILLAAMVLLMVAAAAIMVNRANRISNSGSTELVAHMQLVDWLSEEKYALIFAAQNEDNTPGTLPCPDSASCNASANGISGSPPTTSSVGLPNTTPAGGTTPRTGVPPGACVQYVVAPSLRNSINTKDRGIVIAQQSINLGFVPDLTLQEASNSLTKVWAVLLANPSKAANCNMTNLGYAISFDATGANLSPVFNSSSSNIASDSTIVVPIYKKDLARGLLMQVLQSIDTAKLRSYLDLYASSYGAAHAGAATPPTFKLDIVRNENPSSFDAAVAPTGALLTTGSACSGVISSSSSSLSTSYKTPVSWLCYNAWYGYITYTPQPSSAGSLQLADTETGITCSRVSNPTNSMRLTSCTP